MKYCIAPLFCRPWTLNGISPRLIESHYEQNYGAALNRLNSVTGRTRDARCQDDAGPGHQSSESGADRPAQLDSAS
jgi:hypothetical protein